MIRKPPNGQDTQAQFPGFQALGKYQSEKREKSGLQRLLSLERKHNWYDWEVGNKRKYISFIRSFTIGKLHSVKLSYIPVPSWFCDTTEQPPFPYTFTNPIKQATVFFGRFSYADKTFEW